ncbi:phage tail protein [Actinacidiphila acididurans]|uniref:Phage tail protein n=1 Tax=Actinacidiphila acididurans TaxID=2784346 RepID=A0ABS2TTN9_9ACTN|nr:phage tail protein [Actinacidiphila acididurans]MBM9506691.1 phage tail protein [Actinacidiphila acididurans]
MRATIPGLPTPHPLIDRLPAVYQEQDFLHRFLGALDEVLAPVLLTLDNLPAHLSAGTAPDDFLAWLGQWAAVETDPGRPEARRRELVARAVGQHRDRGTRRGLAAAIRTATGIEPEIAENGATAVSATPGSPLPGSPGPRVTVRLRVPDPERFDRPALEALIAAEVPAHVAHRIEILPAADAGGTGSTGGTP